MLFCPEDTREEENLTQGGGWCRVGRCDQKSWPKGMLFSGCKLNTKKDLQKEGWENDKGMHRGTAGGRGGAEWGGEIA